MRQLFMASVCCVLFTSCIYLRSFPKYKAFYPGNQNDISESAEGSADFYFYDSVLISSPLVVTTKNYHVYIMSQSFYESFSGTEKDLILSDSVFIFGDQYPLQYALKMIPYTSSPQKKYGECLPPKSIFRRAHKIYNISNWFYVFYFKKEIYYKHFVVIDSKERLVRAPSSQEYIQIAFPTPMHICQ